MAKSFSIFATTFFLLVAFTSHCYAVTCVTLTGASKPPTVVAKRTFDNAATLGNSPNTLERVYVNGRSIDEPLLVAIDGDSDGFLNSSKNTTNGVNIVDAEYYYLSNRLGSISAILDADNADRILEYYRYEVFGSATVLPIVDNNTDGLEDTPLDLNDNNAAGPSLVSSFGNTYLYTARRFDDITGLYYYRNRYYDPRSGRFITRDPQETPWSNLYTYVENGVTSFLDPYGLGIFDPPGVSTEGVHVKGKDSFGNDFDIDLDFEINTDDCYIKMIFELGMIKAKGSQIKDADWAQFKQDSKKSIEDAWSDKATLRPKNNCCVCPDGMKLLVEVTIVEGEGDHNTATISNGPARSGVSRSGQISSLDMHDVKLTLKRGGFWQNPLAHEFGHMIGLGHPNEGNAPPSDPSEYHDPPGHPNAGNPSSSIMGSGMQQRPEHYDAWLQAALGEGNVPNGCDWYITVP